MSSHFNIRTLLTCFLLIAPHALANHAHLHPRAEPHAKAASAPASPTSITPVSTAASSTAPSSVSSATVGSAASASSTTEPDVLLVVPELHVGRIELDVDNLQANLNLNADVASLVQINAGVAVSITKVNITITDVDAELELIVRLGHLVDIVNRVFQYAHYETTRKLSPC